MAKNTGKKTKTTPTTLFPEASEGHCQRKTGWIRRDASCKCLWMKSPFRYFKTSPEIIRLAVMMYVRFPLSLRNVEDLLHERGIEVSHETIRFWWNRFGPIFAGEIRKKRTGLNARVVGLAVAPR